MKIVGMSISLWDFAMGCRGGTDSILFSRGGCLVPKDCQPENSCMLLSDCNQFLKGMTFV